MFGKKDCIRCGEKTGNKHNFCPNCGVPFNEKNSKKSDLGMLGDSDEQEMEIANSLFGGFGGKMMGKMLESAMKMLEKEMQKEMKKSKPKTNLQLFVNGKKVDLGNYAQDNKMEEEEISVEKLPNSDLKGFSDLKKKEPSTNIRRLSNKVVYEVDMPGIDSEKDLSIVKLENSIEIKAMSKNKAYRKIIPIGLPIKNYNLSKGKLVLELGVK
ncbi:MAG: hypothetical protein AABX93_01960 [Nanoarchaeota archaeon]